MEQVLDWQWLKSVLYYGPHPGGRRRDDDFPVPDRNVLAAHHHRRRAAEPFRAGRGDAQFLPRLDGDWLDPGPGLGAGGFQQSARHRDRERPGGAVERALLIPSWPGVAGPSITLSPYGRPA